MNDRQLFRGKLKDSGKWAYGGYSEIDGHPVIVEPGERGFTFHIVAPGTVGQCTGLKDREGMLMYGGDILRFNKGNPNVFVVYWSVEDHGWRLVQPSKVGRQPLSIDVEHHVVIGNIHDHPELREEQA